MSDENRSDAGQGQSKTSDEASASPSTVAAVANLSLKETMDEKEDIDAGHDHRGSPVPPSPPAVTCCGLSLATRWRSTASADNCQSAKEAESASEPQISHPAPSDSLVFPENNPPEESVALLESSTLSAAPLGINCTVITQVDYANYFVPKMAEIANCPFYWGKIDRYKAEELLEGKQEGSFLLRDSVQDEFVFSVSFRRYNRSLHARIEEQRHYFSFDCHDPGVHSAPDVMGLLARYQEPLSCMFFEPLLLHPVKRKSPFSLQTLARAAVCDATTYEGVSKLPLPRPLKEYLREYSYRHKIRSRQVDAMRLRRLEEAAEENEAHRWSYLE